MADFNCIHGQVQVDITDGGSAFVAANASGIPRFALNGGSDGSWTTYDYASGLWTGGITQQSGNIGIGTPSPSRSLHVYSTNGLAFKAENNGTGNAVIEIQSDNNAITAINFENSTAFAYGQIAYFNNSNYMTFSTNDAERIRISSSGSVGIGTTSPSYLLQVNGTAFATSWQTPSDARLKKNIAPISGAMDTIKRLQGVHFEWRDVKERSIGKSLDLPADKPQVGFIAQEVQTVVPEAVSIAKDGVMSVQESKVVPILVESVKELNDELNGERSEYNKLKAESDRQSAVVGRLEREVAELRKPRNFASTGTGTILQRVALAFGWN